MFRELETKRLNLLWFDQSDIAGYTLLLNDASSHPYIVDDGPINPKKVAAKIRMNRTATLLGTSLYWTARLTRNGEYVGFTALHSALSKQPILSYAIVPGFRRQGFASEAIVSVVEFALTGLRKRSVLARTHIDNLASQTLLESLGFKFVGKIGCSGSTRLEFMFDHGPMAT